MATYSCRYASLLAVLAATDGAEWPETPACNEPAVFSTVVARDNLHGGSTVRTRTCAGHDAAFRIDPGYRDSIRLPGPPSST